MFFGKNNKEQFTYCKHLIREFLYNERRGDVSEIINLWKQNIHAASHFLRTCVTKQIFWGNRQIGWNDVRSSKIGQKIYQLKFDREYYEDIGVGYKTYTNLINFTNTLDRSVLASQSIVIWTIFFKDGPLPDSFSLLLSFLSYRYIGR